MPPFNLERGLLEKFMYSHIFDSLSYHNKLELLNLLWDTGTLLSEFDKKLKEMIMSIYVLEVTTGQTQTPKQFIMPVVEKTH